MTVFISVGVLKKLQAYWLKTLTRGQNRGTTREKFITFLINITLKSTPLKVPVVHKYLMRMDNKITKLVSDYPKPIAVTMMNQIHSSLSQLLVTLMLGYVSYKKMCL